MLFDLRGRGRQRTVKVIYLFLAILMGGGLVLFGIGGNTSGGIVDAVTGNGGGSTNSGAKAYAADRDRAQAQVEADRGNDAAWLELITSYTALARSTDGYTENRTYDAEGKRYLQSAIQTFERYQATDPDDRDVQGQIASLALNSYDELESNAQGAVDAAEVFAEAKNTPAAYLRFASYAYGLDQERKGELAGQKAVSLAPAAQRKTVRQQVQQLEAQAAQARASATPDAAAGSSPTPSATPDSG